ncbi:MAG: hypothetical protein ACRCX2_09230 [Paraclostridium sp.]
MTINSITITPEVKKGKVGSVVNFGYKIAPSDATDRRVEIKSLHPDIVEVYNNTFRFIKEGFATITVRSLDGGVYREFVITSEKAGGADLSYIIREAEIQLHQYKNMLSNDLTKETTDFKKDLASVSEVCISDIKNIKNNSIVDLLKETNLSKIEISNTVIQKINEIVTKTNESLIELSTAVMIGEQDINDKLAETNAHIESRIESIKTFVESERAEHIAFVENSMSDAVTEIDTAVENKKNEAFKYANEIISNIEKYENFALANIELKFNDSVQYIESAEETALNNINLIKDDMVVALRAEVEGISAMVQNELSNAIELIETAEANAISEISKLEITIKSTIESELDRVREILEQKLSTILLEMNDHNFGLMNQLTAKKNELLQDITVDKDNMLIELEREKNRLIELIRQEEANLFNNLHDKEQETINRIQLTVQGYDLELELIKNAKIDAIQLAVNGYDIMIEEAKNAAQQAVTNLANAFMADMTTAKNSHITEMQNKKNQFTTELTNEKGTHSSNLTKEYNTHKDALNTQVNHSTTGLKKQLQNDYTTHSTALTSEKNTHSTTITNLKNSSVTEITNTKNSALDELGRTSSTGQWGTIRTSLIATGNSETSKVTAEGSRIQDLLLGIESNVIQIGDNAIAAIGTSNSTGKRGEAITAIESNKNSAVQRIGTSDTAMDGSNPSVRKSAYDGIVSIKNSATSDMEKSKTTIVSQANTEITNAKNSAVTTVNQTKDSAIVAINNKKDESLGELNVELSIPSTANKGVRRDANGDVFARHYNGSLKGNADTASKLSASKTFTFSGDVSGSVSFDGSANVTASLQVTDDSHNHIISNVDGLQTELNTLKNNADGRISKSGDTMTGELVASGGILINTDKELSFARNTNYMKIGFKNTGDADTDSYGYIAMGDNGNEYLKIIGKTSTTDTEWASFKADGIREKGNLVYHVGRKPSKADIGLNLVDNTSDSSKNVLSATKLTTARTIGGVSFDGTANINLPGVNTAGNQSTTGNSASATKLQTTRAINGTNFDGTGAITTANWGTARTITIGNTGKTVNGSGNVAWSISELGAMPYGSTFEYSWTKTITMSANTWTSTGCRGITDGTYMLEIYANSPAQDTHYNETYSGIIRWFNSGTNSSTISEVILTSAGHANGDHFICAGYKRVGGNTGQQEIVIACSRAVTNGSYTIRLKRLS